MVLSEGGLAFVDAEPYTLGTRLDLRMALPPQGLGLQVLAEVTGCQAVAGRYEIGTSFIDLEDAQRQLLARHVLRQQAPGTPRRPWRRGVKRPWLAALLLGTALPGWAETLQIPLGQQGDGSTPLPLRRRQSQPGSGALRPARPGASSGRTPGDSPLGLQRFQRLFRKRSGAGRGP